MLVAVGREREDARTDVRPCSRRLDHLSHPSVAVASGKSRRTGRVERWIERGRTLAPIQEQLRALADAGSQRANPDAAWGKRS
jgi:hypothetical protein